MFNNSSQVHHLGALLDENEPESSTRTCRRRLTSDPCLPMRLPSTAFISREGERDAPKAVLKQLRRSPSPPQSSERERSVGRRSSSSSVNQRKERSTLSPKASAVKNIRTAAAWREPQAFEVFRAVEQKDLMFLMEIRDRAFHLLLRRSGDATPLVHAMRIGESHRDVAIVLLGAMSRWVNNLEDDDLSDKKIKVLLKALRANLKLAIDYGLQNAQSDLIASFLQTLIMSEGEKWVRDQTSNVALALRAGTEGKPVNTAEAAVRKFATKALEKAQLIAALEDYIANATADLLLMGAWSCALDSLQGEPIPTYYFARDDRVYKAFQDRVYEHRAVISLKLSKRLRWQIRVLEQVLAGRNTTYRSKIELLVGEFDEGDGV